jgi:hypothetical protein
MFAGQEAKLASAHELVSPQTTVVAEALVARRLYREWKAAEEIAFIGLILIIVLFALAGILE